MQLGGGLTVTVLLADAKPPTPLQVRVNVVFVNKADETCDPDIVLAPLHPPLAEHDVAPVELHERLVVLPDWIADGLAFNVTVGATQVPTVIVDD